MKVKCDVEYIDLDGDYGPVAGVRVTCSRCSAEEESFGSSEASVIRCMVLLREGCPKREKNFYVEDEDPKGLRPYWK